MFHFFSFWPFGPHVLPMPLSSQALLSPLLLLLQYHTAYVRLGQSSAGHRGGGGESTGCRGASGIGGDWGGTEGIGERERERGGGMCTVHGVSEGFTEHVRTSSLFQVLSFTSCRLTSPHCQTLPTP